AGDLDGGAVGLDVAAGDGDLAAALGRDRRGAGDGDVGGVDPDVVLPVARDRIGGPQAGEVRAGGGAGLAGQARLDAGQVRLGGGELGLGALGRHLGGERGLGGGHLRPVSGLAGGGAGLGGGAIGGGPRDLTGLAGELPRLGGQIARRGGRRAGRRGGGGRLGRLGRGGGGPGLVGGGHRRRGGGLLRAPLVLLTAGEPGNREKRTRERPLHRAPPSHSTTKSTSSWQGKSAPVAASTIAQSPPAHVMVAACVALPRTSLEKGPSAVAWAIRVASSPGSAASWWARSEQK